MAELPPARINAPPLRYRMPWLRHWPWVLGLGAVVGLGWWKCGWFGPRPDFDHDWAKRRDTTTEWREYVEKTGKRDVGRKEVARLHRTALAYMQGTEVPRLDELEVLLGSTRDRVDERISVIADGLVVDRDSFAAVEAELRATGGELVPIADQLEHSYMCQRGLTAAFTELTGAELVVFDDSIPDDDGPRLTVRWTARASGAAYGTQHSRRVYPGFELDAQLVLMVGDRTLASLDATVTPGPNVEYTTSALTSAFGNDSSEVVGGMVGAGCQRLGERVIEELTGRAPPVPPVAGLVDQIAACGDGDADACLEIGLRFRDGDGVTADKARAADYFQKGCNASGLAAASNCMPAAALIMEQPADTAEADMDRRIEATMVLERACTWHQGAACARLAELELTPYFSGEGPSDHGEHDALILRVRACDLGDAGACYDAATMAGAGKGLGGASSPARAAVLADRACARGVAESCDAATTWHQAAKRERTVHGVELGKRDQVFDVRFGTWFEQAESAVVWIASSDSATAIGSRLAQQRGAGLARVYELEALPPGVVPPPSARAVYALIKQPGGLRIDGSSPRCPECTPESAHPSGFDLRGFSCPCLPPPP